MANQQNTEDTFLVCDIGGTNTTFALIAGDPDSFHIVARHREATQQLSTFAEGLERAFTSFRNQTGAVHPRHACVSAAGPVHEGTVQLTNASWNVDSAFLQDRSGVSVSLINDLSAVSYGVPLVNRDNPQEFHRLPHPDGSDPAPSGSIRAVVAAGTGLGVGFLSGDGDELRVFPSEGGHSTIGDFDGETHEFRTFLREEYGEGPEAEMFASGQGIAYAAEFVLSDGGFAHGRIAETVRTADRHERPALVSRYAAEDRDCRRAMRLFVRMYGKFAANIALTVLPYAGMYLGGGIAAKNLSHLVADNCFMTAFRTHINEAMQAPLARVPVGIILDYEISLFGCAHCAYLEWRKGGAE
ncbi:MAG: glucokinase [Spirochaetales bacterium]